MPNDKPLLDDELGEPIPILTVEQIKEALNKIPKRRFDRDDVPKDDRTGVCVVCKGNVIAKVGREFRGDPMSRIIGPGSRKQMSVVHYGFHCINCGLKYEFPPHIIAETPEDV